MPIKIDGTTEIAVLSLMIFLEFYLVVLLLFSSLTITEHIQLHYWSIPVTVNIQINKRVKHVFPDRGMHLSEQEISGLIQ